MAEDERRRRPRAEMGLAGLGFDLAAAVAVATLLGWWIDRRYETAPWGLIICSLIGIVGGLYNFAKAGHRAARKAQRRQEGDDSRE